MNYKTTLLLVVALLAAGGFYWSTRTAPSTFEVEQERAEAAAIDGVPLFSDADVQASSVVRVEIVADGRRLVFEKIAGEWMQTEPIRFALRTWEVSDFVTDVIALRHEESFVPGKKKMPTREELGLEPTVRASVRLFDDSSDTRPVAAVRFGRVATGGFAYAEKPSDPEKNRPVYVVDADVVETIFENGDQGGEGWRKKELSIPSVAAVSRVSIAGLKDELVIERQTVNGDERWTLSGRARGRASAKAVRDFLDHVDGLKVSEFVADAPESTGLYGLGHVARVVTIEASEAADVTDSISKSANTKSANTNANTNANGTNTNGADTSDADTTEAEPSGANTTDTNTGDDKPAAKPPHRVTRIMLGAATDLLRDSFFIGWADPMSDEVDPGPGVVLAISKADYDMFDPAIDTLRDPSITPTPKDAIRQLAWQPTDEDGADEAEQNDTNRGFEIVMSDGSWTFSDRALGYRPDAESVAAVLSAVVSATADRFFPLETEVGELIGAIVINGDETLTIERGQATALAISTGPESDSGDRDAGVVLLVRRSGDAVARVVTGEQAEAMGAVFTRPEALRERTVLGLDVRSVKRITVERPDATRAFVFEKKDGETKGGTKKDNEVKGGEKKDGHKNDRDKNDGKENHGVEQTVAAGEAGVFKLLDEPGGTEPGTLTALVRNLFPLRAEAWLPDDTTIKPPFTTVTIDAIDGSQGVLTIDRNTGAARIDGFAGVFRLGKSVFDAIHAEFRNRTLVEAPAGLLTRLMVDQLAGELVFTPSADDASVLELREPADANLEVDPEKLMAWTTMLTKLKVERYVDRPVVVGLDDSRRVEVAVSLVDGRVVRFAAWPDARQNLGRLLPAGRWFRVSDDVMSVIDTPLVESE